MKVKTKVRKKRQPDLAPRAKLKLPMDYPWKVLTWLSHDLADMLSEDDNALVDQIIRDRDTAALNCLSDMWGLQGIGSMVGIKLSAIRARYQLSALLKKYKFPGKREQRIESAKTKFYKAEDVCSQYNHSGYNELIWSQDERGAEIFSHARGFLQKLLGSVAPTRSLLTRWSRHGPGSNLDTCEGKISLYDKYKNWPYSCTAIAIPYARFLISTDKRWLGALQDDYRTRFNISKHAILNQEVFWENVLKVVPGNRITFVPKNALTERTIAIEPTMNLMLQLGVDGFIRSRLKRFDVNLDDQKKNQVLAFRGSINPNSDSYVTLDLSMASDTISLRLCKELLPSEWFTYLCKLRSPQGVLGDEVISYEKISSMGNGYTFALESALFTAVLYAVHQVEKGSIDFKQDISVFGDDLIVRKDVSQACIDALLKCGFSLNLEKSFLSGKVRESCGADWYEGHPVRPVFFDEAPTDVMGLLVDVNRLTRLLSLRWGLEESETATNMAKWIPEYFRNFTGPRSDTEFDSHLHVSAVTGRYRHCLWEYRRLIKKPVSRTCNDFLFRKLMHNLQGPESQPRPFIGQRKLTGAGSRFIVLKSYSSTIGTTYSRSDHWSDMYAELDSGR